jgi:4-hydroxy-4-methyl-2-oxoglutarate aldolase
MNTPLPNIAKYAIGEAPDPLSADLLAVMQQIDTPMLGHILWWGHMDVGIKASRDFGPRTTGRALTVQCPAADSTMLHHAVGLAQPGDILVIDRLGDRTYACLGDGVAAAAIRAGIIGAIIDGPCTDADEMVALGFPVWCRGTSPVTTRLLDSGGTVYRPVAVGGVAVVPGAAIIADASGVFALSPEDAVLASSIALTRARIVEDRRKTRKSERPLGEMTGASALVERSCI